MEEIGDKLRLEELRLPSVSSSLSQEDSELM